MPITKKYMLEDYPRLERKAGLLDLYLHDTLTGRKPDADVTKGEFRAILYRATGAHGGYVCWNILGSTWIEYLDESIERSRTDESYPDRRTIVSKLQAKRYSLLYPKPLDTPDYAVRVAALEAEGLCTSDAQAVVDAEDLKLA